jgi:DNA-binding response OmpR family regulator
MSGSVATVAALPCNRGMGNPENSAARVLLVDDDEQLCEMLSEYLTADGFDVAAVHDGGSGVTEVSQGDYDVVVMDITMPVLDGFEALRRIRTTSAVPVLMLTARGEELDRIVGLEIGADDYLPKPFNPRELVARLRAILRRARLPTESAGGPIEIDDLTLEPGSRSLLKNGQPVDLTTTEYGIIDMLARSAGEIVRKEDLSREVLGRELTPYDRSLDTHVANLRKKLGPLGNDGVRIKTIRGRGYLFVRHGSSA